MTPHQICIVLLIFYRILIIVLLSLSPSSHWQFANSVDFGRQSCTSLLIKMMLTIMMVMVMMMMVVIALMVVTMIMMATNDYIDDDKTGDKVKQPFVHPPTARM